MPGKRGRPVQPSLGVWRDPEVLGRRVKTIVSRRDPDDEETVTLVGQQLTALALRVLGRPLTEKELARLRKLASTAKPSQTTRVLVSWRFKLPDRKVRALSKAGLLEARWA
jgi:hypothetical protein